MAHVVCSTFNPFQENTYVVYDETKSCLIIDPGCYEANEKTRLMQFIQQNRLTPVRLLNTHCHIDHVFGNAFIAATYGLGLEIHEGEEAVLNFVPQVAQLYSIPYPEPSPKPAHYLVPNTTIEFGNTVLKILFVPGHSPASVAFYSAADQFVIAGDVLFKDSVGRTDLPGGNHQTLLDSIQKELLSLNDEVLVYSGHRPKTSIGRERRNNPFLVNLV